MAYTSLSFNPDNNSGEKSNNKLTSNNYSAPFSTERVTGQSWLLVTLEKLLAIESIDVKSALSEASDLVSQALGADKVDVFLYDKEIDTLVAMGVSHTPLGRKQVALGLNRIPISGGGRTVITYQEQTPYITGHSDQDPEQLPGVINELHVRSVISVPLYWTGELQGVLEATAMQTEAFDEYDLSFLQAVAGWVGTILHRSRLNEQLRVAAVEEARQETAEELVTVIAHDLRNYLTPLIGRVSFIHKRALREGRERDLEDSEKLDTILRGMERMVSDLLDVSRLEQGLFAVSKMETNLVELVKESANAFDTPQQPIQVQASGEVLVEVDHQRIKQAVENLLLNALKYSPEGVPIILTISTEPTESETGSWARITISDKGPGISPELFPQLFKRFKKDPSSLGMGLGLYLAQGIAHAHGGILTVESASDLGTTFQLSLPIIL